MHPQQIDQLLNWAGQDEVWLAHTVRFVRAAPKELGISTFGMPEVISVYETAV